MRKGGMVAVAVFFVGLLVVPGTVFCKSEDAKWSVGYRYGYVNIDDADFKTDGNSHDLTVGYELTDNLAVEAQSGHYRLKTHSGTGLDVVSALLNLQLRYPLKKFVPYLVGGLGWQFYKYGNLYVDDKKDNRSSFSYKGGAGLDYFLRDDLSLGGEISYLYGNTGGGATLDVYHWRYCVGVKYHF